MVNWKLEEVKLMILFQMRITLIWWWDKSTRLYGIAKKQIWQYKRHHICKHQILTNYWSNCFLCVKHSTSYFQLHMSIFIDIPWLISNLTLSISQICHHCKKMRKMFHIMLIFFSQTFQCCRRLIILLNKFIHTKK